MEYTNGWAGHHQAVPLAGRKNPHKKQETSQGGKVSKPARASVVAFGPNVSLASTGQARALHAPLCNATMDGAKSTLAWDRLANFHFPGFVRVFGYVGTADRISARERSRYVPVRLHSCVCAHACSLAQQSFWNKNFNWCIIRMLVIYAHAHCASHWPRVQTRGPDADTGFVRVRDSLASPNPRSCRSCLGLAA